ncbi:hypothetical protein HCU64_15975 [Methylobacterium sp. C25]|uniref:hypothetical protein n=1 Tax=Methylobacterium sp. C25 TaxID=2721622 RepID=UPI001F3DB592|nr:hypothetical protein [Methylobacterium sp. C25]MCE4225255.1 hypothetical protein [Methylobacterium sp. C25]
MSDITPYTVTGLNGHNRITYRCPTAEWALKKLRDFLHAEYAEIVVTDPAKNILNEADLAALVDINAAGGAAVNIDAPKAPTLAS